MPCKCGCYSLFPLAPGGAAPSPHLSAVGRRHATLLSLTAGSTMQVPSPSPLRDAASPPLHFSGSHCATRQDLAVGRHRVLTTRSHRATTSAPNIVIRFVIPSALIAGKYGTVNPPSLPPSLRGAAPLLSVRGGQIYIFCNCPCPLLDTQKIKTLLGIRILTHHHLPPMDQNWCQRMACN